MEMACSLMPHSHRRTPTAKTNAIRTAFIFQNGALDASIMTAIWSPLLANYGQTARGIGETLEVLRAEFSEELGRAGDMVAQSAA